MKKRITIFYTALVAVALLFMFGLGILVTRNEHYESAKEKIKEVTEIYAELYPSTKDLPLKKISEGIRVTVMDATGNVIADSDGFDPATMENHLDREEILSALKGSPTPVTRQSGTAGKEMMYYAEKVAVEDSFVFIRTAIPVESVNSYIYKSAFPMVFILLFALTAALFAAIFLSGGLLAPLGKVKTALADIGSGNFRRIPPTTDDEDINRMLASINDIAARLETTVAKAEEEKEKLDYILNHISDGIAVFDSSACLLALNRSAKEIFGLKEEEGKPVEALCAEEAFLHAVHDCADTGKGSLFRMEKDGRCYLCTVSAAEDGVTFAVLTDITAEENSEKTRLEFFANASHELKTPLTAIRGFGELISLSDTDEKTKGYAARIGKESERMLALIDDMLHLSRLENTRTAEEKDLAPVDLRKIADDVKESLHPVAENKKVSLSVSGEATVLAEKEEMYELVKNLAENAVRYNVESGKVEILLSGGTGTGEKEPLLDSSFSSSSHEGHTLSARGGENRKEPEEILSGPTLIVRDTGIGIDPAHQARIFERFYRVDKSRSRATGGTGLGLAIVKHICERYGATLTLRSRLGEGTEITVKFNSANTVKSHLPS